MKGVKLLVACFFLASLMLVPITLMAQDAAHVGVVYTPSDVVAKKCYRLVRNKQVISRLQEEMLVQNGDAIIPLGGCRPILEYINTGCGRKTVAVTSTVKCNPAKLKKAGGFLQRLLRPIIKRTTLKRVHHTTERKIPPPRCYPKRAEFWFPSWPVEGTTFLPGELIWFRWEENTMVCQPAQLVVEYFKGRQPITAVVKPIRIGELVPVKIKLDPGKSYRWFIRQSGARVSRVYSFKVLNTISARNIGRQLSEVGEAYQKPVRGVSPCQAKALYLIVISEIDRNLDLYADSLKLIRNCLAHNALHYEISDRMFRHSLEKGTE